MKNSLTLLAGSKALSIIRDEGLRPERVMGVAGAAGGPKWLVLYHMDRMLVSEFFKGRRNPLFLIGASSGAWRFAAWGQKDALGALARFRDAYTNQVYETRPTPAEVSAEGRRIIDAYIDGEQVEEILTHPFFRAAFLAARAKFFSAFQNPYLQMAGLTGVAVHNLISRRWLGFSFDRMVFHDARMRPPINDRDGIPTRFVSLAGANFKKALLASGSIPMVMSGVRNIPDAPAGVYLDGGVVDYHLSLPYDIDTESIILMPHYTNRIIPGWLDKKLPFRQANPAYIQNLLVVAPTDAFQRQLPGGKIPDRTDFRTYFGKDRERIGIWEAATEACRSLGEEFMGLAESGRIGEAAVAL